MITILYRINSRTQVINNESKQDITYTYRYQGLFVAYQIGEEQECPNNGRIN